MRLDRILRHRLRSLFRRSSAEADMQRELALHLEQLVKENMAEGLSEAEARRAALREFGPLEATKDQPRVLKSPAPVCFLVEFGESAVNFSLRFWIRDPAGGISNLRSAVMLALWDSLKREGIEIPFAQREVNVKGPVTVMVESRDQASRPA